MSRIDLNIVDRGIQGSNWIAEDIGLTPEHLDSAAREQIAPLGADLLVCFAYGREPPLSQIQNACII